jgi:IS605 OrfB family transposase
VGGIGENKRFLSSKTIHICDSLNRAIVLQTNNLTKHKKQTLDIFSTKALKLANSLLKKRKSKKLMDLHKATYLKSKKLTSFNSQVVCDIERNVVKSKGTIFKKITVKFNLPRNCNTFTTKTNYFVKLGLYPKKHIAIPIEKNINFQRYIALLDKGWICKTYGLTSDKQIVAYLSKEDTVFTPKRNMLGIDVNSKCFSISILAPKGKILKQLYFGKDMWVKRKKIFEHRQRLQSLADKGSHKAIQSLRKLKTYETNFIKNRLGEIVKEITNLAIKYDADISIEKLKRFKPLGKKVNREIMSIPFYAFKQLLISRCFDKQIPLHIVDSYHTSKWCTHCGAVVDGHSSSNYSLFKCKCGQVVNSDRKASLAVAVKSLLERNSVQTITTEFFQISNRQVPVNGLLRSNDIGCIRAVHVNQPLNGKPTPFMGG